MIPYLLAVAGGYLIGQSFKDDDTYASGGRIKSYEKVEGTDYELKIEVYYDKGGMNYFSGRPEERGYYASVSPVKIERRPNGITTEEYGAFSGIKTLVLRVARQSPKAEKEAEMLAQERIPELKNYVLGKMKDKGIIMAKGGAIELGPREEKMIKDCLVNNGFTENIIISKESSWRNKKVPYWRVYAVNKDKNEKYEYINDEVGIKITAQDICKDIDRYVKYGKMAQGGVLEHGLREDDRILVERGRFAGIKNDKTGEKFIVDIEEGSRTPSRL